MLESTHTTEKYVCLGRTMGKHVFRHMQWRPRSDCTKVQSDQGLHCLLTESLDTTECMNGEQRPG